MSLRARASFATFVVLAALALVPAPSLARRAAPTPTASVPPSGALSAELRARLARIPDEGTPDPGEHYPVSNEWRHDLWLPAIRDLGGIFVGVGPDQCYTLAAMQHASLALLVDFDPMVPLVHRMYEVLVPATETPAALVDRFQDAHAAETRALLESGLANDPQRDTILRLYDRNRPRWARYVRAVRRSVRDGVAGSWLADDALYARVRTMFQEGRIVARNGDVTGARTMREIGAISQELGEPVRVLYFSNAEQFFSYTPAFLENVRSMRMDERSIVLRTFRARGATYPTHDRWHYVVEPAAGFLERLGGGLHRSRELEIEIVSRRRARGATPGFTQLER
ncbi:MAG: hypothetical protein K1X94_28675 [Sandaracinaceae bacterium]|nr:hypothetical protein [Sandaracinaceae bacterium]